MAARITAQHVEPRRTKIGDGPRASGHASGDNTAPARPSMLELILELEGEARKAATADELQYLAVNSFRRITGARQTFLLRLKPGNAPQVAAVSSVAVVDREAPLIRWVEALARSFHAAEGSGVEKAFRLPAYAENITAETADYPFRHVYWQPLRLSDGTAFAVIVQTCERPFSETDQKASARLAGTVSHAWRAIVGEKRLKPRKVWRRWAVPCAAALVIAAGALPVPLTTIAPVQIVPAQPFIVAAPLDGVIERVTVAANSLVKAGDPLVAFDATTLKNRVALAERELGVAQENLSKHTQQAFFEDAARYQLAISRAERELKAAELAYARDLLAKSKVIAPVAGVAIYGDREEIEGHPVSTGQTIMKIANPERVEVEIDLPVSDAINIREGARVRVFLDLNPLNAINARILKGSYEAKPEPNGQLVYKLRAQLTNTTTAPPRIGARGTAQVFGEQTSLAFFLFRRPLSALRQQFGV